MQPAWDTATGTITIGTPVLWWTRPHVAHQGVVIAADPTTGWPVIAVTQLYGPTTRATNPATLHRHTPPGSTTCLPAPTPARRCQTWLYM